MNTAVQQYAEKYAEKFANKGREEGQRELAAAIKRLKDGETVKGLICFGTKKLYDARLQLLESGFESHDHWLRMFREKT